MKIKFDKNKQTSFLSELVVDNFAGGGGASTGMELALGRPVDIAINHDPDAIAMHKKNHPYTQHFCESVWDIDPRKVTQGRPVGLAWFSPDCKHFSKAKGGKPVEKHIRGLAWVAVRWAATVKPRVIILENVEEFKTWGPITKDGYPDKSQSGRTFNSFVNALRYIGYTVDWRELRACDYGAPTIRKRFFLIARCDGQPIIFPTPTHGKPDSADVKSGKLKPWRTAAEIIDWSIPCPSIFDRKRPLEENTMKRIARGLKKFVFENAEPFLMNIQFNNGERSVKEPIQTLTGVRKDYIVTPIVTKFQQNSAGQSPDAPLDTVMAGAARFGVVTPYMVPIGYGEREGQQPRVSDIQSPVSTVVSTGKQAIVTPYLMAIGQTGFSKDRTNSEEEPLRTQVSKAEHCLIAPILTQYHSYDGEGARGQKLEKPLLTVDTSNRYALTCAFITKSFGGGYTSHGADKDDPLGTVTAVDHHNLVTAFISRQFKSSVGHEMDAPLGTCTAVDKSRLVEAFLIKYYGSDGEGNNQSLYDPLGTVTSKDRFGLVMVHGEPYRIVDIGMRMLTPRELYNAQGFPSDYVIDVDADGKAYPKNKQVARCGNAVPPPFAEALVRANFQDQAAETKIATMAALNERIAITA